MRLRYLISAAFFFCPSLFADYAWIQEFEKLSLRTGFDVSTTSRNYDHNGFSSNPTFNSQLVSLQDLTFWAEPEYGIAQDWSVGLRLGFLSGTAASLTSGLAVAQGASLADTRANLKWRLSKEPLWTAEMYFKFPTGVAAPRSTTDIVVGEGNLDVGVKFHYGLQQKNLFFSVSPGLLARFAGYASAATLDAAAQIFIARAYGKIFVSSIFSFSPTALPPSDITSQSLGGTVGSYARLAASPTLVTAGASFGVLLSRKFRFEIGVSKTVWGQRAPDFLAVTFNLLGLFDFAKPDLRPKIREVPFEDAPADS